MTAGAAAWFPFGPARPAARLTLFCLHHAGGGASAFARWRAPMAPDIDVAPVLLPGREQRIDEPLFDQLPALVDALAEALGSRLDRPYALFGHSFGAALALELAARLVPAPQHLFVSAWCPPVGPLRAVASMPPAPLSEPEVLAYLARYGGIAHVLARDAEMMRLLLGPLRADIELLRSYQPTSVARPRCPLTILGGRDDPMVAPQRLLRWAQSIDAPAPLILPGGHFYLREDLPAVLGILKTTLAGAAPARAVPSWSA